MQVCLTLSRGASQWTGFYMITASVLKGLNMHDLLLYTRISMVKLQAIEIPEKQ